jgi:hypothetical protein
MSKIIDFYTDSHLQWKGLNSEKFRLGNRKHLSVQDELNGLQADREPLKGRKHF